MHAIRTHLATVALAMALGTGTCVAQGFPAIAPRGIDADVRALAASSEPVAFVARCVADLTRAAQGSGTVEDRRREEGRAWRLMQAMSAVASATSVPPMRAAGALALTLMPLATTSISLSPGGGAPATVDLAACRTAADDPDAYLSGLRGR